MSTAKRQLNRIVTRVTNEFLEHGYPLNKARVANIVAQRYEGRILGKPLFYAKPKHPHEPATSEEMQRIQDDIVEDLYVLYEELLDQSNALLMAFASAHTERNKIKRGLLDTISQLDSRLLLTRRASNYWESYTDTFRDSAGIDYSLSKNVVVNGDTSCLTLLSNTESNVQMPTSMVRKVSGFVDDKTTAVRSHGNINAILDPYANSVYTISMIPRTTDVVELRYTLQVDFDVSKYEKTQNPKDKPIINKAILNVPQYGCTIEMVYTYDGHNWISLGNKETDGFSKIVWETNDIHVRSIRFVIKMPVHSEEKMTRKYNSLCIKSLELLTEAGSVSSGTMVSKMIEFPMLESVGKAVIYADTEIPSGASIQWFITDTPDALDPERPDSASWVSIRPATDQDIQNEDVLVDFSYDGSKRIRRGGLEFDTALDVWGAFSRYPDGFTATNGVNLYAPGAIVPSGLDHDIDIRQGFRIVLGYNQMGVQAYQKDFSLESSSIYRSLRDRWTKVPGHILNMAYTDAGSLKDGVLSLPKIDSYGVASDECLRRYVIPSTEIDPQIFANGLAVDYSSTYITVHEDEFDKNFLKIRNDPLSEINPMQQNFHYRFVVYITCNNLVAIERRLNHGAIKQSDGLFYPCNHEDWYNHEELAFEESFGDLISGETWLNNRLIASSKNTPDTLTQFVLMPAPYVNKLEVFISSKLHNWSAGALANELVYDIGLDLGDDTFRANHGIIEVRGIEKEPERVSEYDLIYNTGPRDKSRFALVQYDDGTWGPIVNWNPNKSDSDLESLLDDDDDDAESPSEDLVSDTINIAVKEFYYRPPGATDAANQNNKLWVKAELFSNEETQQSPKINQYQVGVL